MHFCSGYAVLCGPLAIVKSPSRNNRRSRTMDWFTLLTRAESVPGSAGSFREWRCPRRHSYCALKQPTTPHQPAPAAVQVLTIGLLAARRITRKGFQRTAGATPLKKSLVWGPNAWALAQSAPEIGPAARKSPPSRVPIRAPARLKYYRVVDSTFLRTYVVVLY